MGNDNKRKSFMHDADLYIACLTLAVLIAVTIGGVVMRYVVNRPLGWIEEVQLWCFLWTVFFGAGAVARGSGHIAIDAFVGLFPRVLRNLARSISLLVTIAVVGFVGYYGLRLVIQMYNTGRVTNILSVPYYIIYGALPLSCLIMVCVALKYLVHPRQELSAVEAAIKEVEDV